MKNKILAVAVASMALGANAANMNDITMSGFGSIGVGTSDNDVGYANYTDDNEEWENETLVGLQFNIPINERANFITQLVSNSLYDYEVKIAMAYASYEFDSFTVRAGKFRMPLYFYSDYTDTGYAYPMMRPSQEVYNNTLIKSATAVDLLIPIEFDDYSILLQPIIGVATIDEADSAAFQTEVKLDNSYGLIANVNINDVTLRIAYFSGQANTDDGQLEDIDSQFITAGVQYDNGSFLTNIEGADVQVEGITPDYQAVTSLVAYKINEVTPYLSAGWVKTTDDDERSGLYELFNYEYTAYSMGTRWDFAQNMALKFDVTYADYHDTSGGYTDTNVNWTTFQIIEDSSTVYSAKLDVIF